jgi:putative cardiolipin synthase
MMKSLLSLIIVVGTFGCAFKKDVQNDVQRIVASEENNDEASLPLEIYPYRVHLNTSHQMKIINDGTSALFERVRMIREAKSTLDLEYFIFNPDASGRIIVTELVKAAKRNVKVRILVDKSVAVFAMDEFYAKILKENNIEIRYYNAASFLQISTVQFRNHRKLISRDGVEAITGGRNIADEYFHLAKEFNFLDRDVLVKGEIVTAMEKTFDIYWDADIVQKPSAPSAPVNRVGSGDARDAGRNASQYKSLLANFKKRSEDAKKLIVLTEEDQKILSFVVNYGQRNPGEARVCPSVAFATDREGGNFKTRIHSTNYNLNYRILRKEIALWMNKINDEVVLDSPYFLNDSNSREILEDLLSKKKKVTIFTNSLASTDAIYVSTVFSDEVKKYTPNKDFNAYIYKGTFSDESELYSDEVKNSMWGTHSKTIVYNEQAFMVGTFNIDNRSNFYNSEMALFCDGSQELTRDIESNIHLRMKTSHHLNEDGKPDDGTKLLEGNSKEKKGIYFLLKVPSKMLQFLL